MLAIAATIILGLILIAITFTTIYLTSIDTVAIPTIKVVVALVITTRSLLLRKSKEVCFCAITALHAVTLSSSVKVNLIKAAVAANLISTIIALTSILTINLNILTIPIKLAYDSIDNITLIIIVIIAIMLIVIDHSLISLASIRKTANLVHTPISKLIL